MKHHLGWSQIREEEEEEEVLITKTLHQAPRDIKLLETNESVNGKFEIVKRKLSIYKDIFK